MKIAITGGAGFIGSNLALELEKRGDNVTIIDNFSSGNLDNLKNFKGKIIEKDVSIPFELKEKFELIYHLASITDTTFQDDNEMIRQNVESFEIMMKKAVKMGAKLIYASSAAVYGNGPTPMKEAQKPEPLNAYAKSKAMMDEIFKENSEKMSIIGLRFFNVFGPREKYKGKSSSMIWQIRNKILNNEAIKLFKFGEQVRDHIYVKDIIDACIKVIDAKNGIFNVGTGIGTSFNELVEVLNELLGKNAEIVYINNPIKKVYQANTQADTNLAEKELGFMAKYSFKEGVKDYLEYLENE